MSTFGRKPETGDADAYVPIDVLKKDLTALSVTRLAPQTKSNVDDGRIQVCLI
jgi:hypothetical protein